MEPLFNSFIRNAVLENQYDGFSRHLSKGICAFNQQKGTNTQVNYNIKQHKFKKRQSTFTEKKKQAYPKIRLVFLFIIISLHLLAPYLL